MPGKADIEHDRMRRLFTGAVERLKAIVGQHDLVTSTRQ